MSQYDREGAGMNCGGRNQFGITDEGLIGIKQQLSKGNVSLPKTARPTPTHQDLVEDLKGLIQSAQTKEDIDQFFKKHPDARIVTYGGCITRDGFEAN